MEEEKFSLLPSGSAAEEMLRSYAAYLGLNVAEALDEYRRRHFSNPTTPPIALGGVRPARQLPRWITWVVAVVLALVLGGGAIYLFDPNWLFVMGDRAWALMVPSTATPEPTQTPPPTQAPAPTATSTPAPTDTPTLTPTVTPRPTSTPRPTDTPAALTPTVTPRP
jgi:cytoskeletal protein RodZ